MKQWIQIFALSLLMTGPVSETLAASVSKKSPAPVESTTQKKTKEIQWQDLMPMPDEEIVRMYQDGEIDRETAIKMWEDNGTDPVRELNGTKGRIPGYLVPLNLDKDMKATELLLVPTVGACIHVPPPPANQIIYLKLKEGIKVTEAGFTPYWIEGTIKVKNNSSEYTDTVYSMQSVTIEEYQWD